MKQKLRLLFQTFSAPLTACPRAASLLLALGLAIPFATCTRWFVMGDYPAVRYFGNLFVALCYYLACVWIMCAGAVFLRRWARWAANVWIGVCLVLAFLNCLMNVSYFAIYYEWPGIETVAATMGTNRQEALEFIGSFFSLDILIIIVCIAILYLIIKGLYTLGVGTRMRYVIAGMALFGLIVPAYRNRDVWFATLAGKIDMMCRLPEDLPLIDERLPLSVTDPETPPDHIVVIIGESHSSDCSQLYGYDLPTNPLLSAMQADSSLFVFTDATSRYYHTINCFRSFMTATHDDKPWNECENAFEVAASRGYQTFWLSNQSPVGFNDNAIATMASRADKVAYTTVAGEVDYSALPYDEALTSMLDSLIDPGSKQLFFVHLMGSHRSFENRYPADREHFRPSDYAAYPASQREDRARYDNSLLYNDSVVSTLFRRLDSLDAVGLYFSDHGVDVFQSPSVTRITHANSDSLSMKAAARIPMLIYASPRYRTIHPLKMERLRRSLDTPVKNTQMVYTLMDMMGVRFRDDNRVDSLSAIRP